MFNVLAFQKKVVKIDIFSYEKITIRLYSPYFTGDEVCA